MAGLCLARPEACGTTQPARSGLQSAGTHQILRRESSIDKSGLAQIDLSKSFQHVSDPGDNCVPVVERARH